MQLWYFTLRVHHNKADAVRSARPWGGDLAEFLLVTFKKNGTKIRLVEKYCNMQITEKIDYSVGQIYE